MVNQSWKPNIPESDRVVLSARIYFYWLWHVLSQIWKNVVLDMSPIPEFQACISMPFSMLMTRSCFPQSPGVWMNSYDLLRVVQENYGLKVKRGKCHNTFPITPLYTMRTKVPIWATTWITRSAFPGKLHKECRTLNVFGRNSVCFGICQHKPQVAIAHIWCCR